MQGKYFAIFGGGGIRGLSYCGAYKALEENNIELTGCAGSSVGAIFAGLLSIGYNCNEIFEILSSVGIDMFMDINMDFTKEVGFSKGNKFYEWIKEKIEQKFYGESYKKGSMKPIRFKDLNKNLIIFSVDLINMRYNEFSDIQTPNEEIAKAIRASVSMPGLFKPLEYDDKLLADGDLLKSMPLWRATNSIKLLKDRILEFRLEDNQTTKKVENSIEYLNRVYNLICGTATDYIIDLYNQKDKFDYIKIDTPNISVIDFLIPKEKKQELYEIGYKTTNEYFKKFLPQKTQKLHDKYNTLLEKFNSFQKEFNSKNYFNSYVTLCEIFMYLCEEKKYIDSSIFETLINFKNDYIKNYKLFINILGFKKANLKNKETLNKEILEIIKILTSKVEELKK